MIPKKTKFNRTLFVVGDMGATVIILILWAHLLIQASGKLSFVDNRHCFFLKNYEVYVEHFKLSNTIQITRLYHESADHRSNDLLAEFTEMNLYLEKSVLLISEKIDQNKVKLKQLAAQPIEFVNRSPGNHSDGTAAEGLLQQRLRYIYYKFVRLYIVKDTSTFLQYLRILDVNKFLAAARTLTVIMFSSQDADLEAMQTLLQYLWKKYSILNVLAQFPCSDKKEFIFTYKPFRMTRRGYGAFEAYHYRDGLTNPDFLLTDVEQLNGYTLRLAQFERYPSSTLNIPKVLTENPIYVNRGAMKLYGIDAMMMAELQRQMNFSVEMYEGFLGQSYGKVNDDGQAVGSLKAVIDRIIDIHGNSRFIVNYEIEGYEFTYRFDNDHLCLIAPVSGNLPKWQTMFKLFTSNIGMIILFNAFISLLNKWFSGPALRYSDAIFEVFSVAVGQAMYSPRITRPLSHRVFFTSVLVYCIVTTTIFAAVLLIIFTETFHLPEIDTLEDFAKSGQEIVTSYNAFEDIARQPYIDLAKRVKAKPPETNLTSIELAAQLKTGGIERYYDANIQIKTTLADEHGNEVLHIVAECINTYNLAFLVPLGSPYLDVFNRVIIWAGEVGLTYKWYYDFYTFYIYQYRVHQLKRHNHSSDEDSSFLKYTFEDFKGPLLIFVMGNVMAVFIFILEICRGFICN